MTPGRDLLFTLTRLQLSERFRGSVLGGSWMILNPLLTILLLSFVFGGLLRVRWNIDGAPAYPIMLFGGLIVHLFVGECLTRSATLMTERPDYIHKIAFPLSVLGLVMVVEGCIVFLASLILFLLISWGFGFPPSLPWLLLPIVLLPLPLVGLGIAWGIGAVGPYVPDLKQIVGPAATALLLLSPVLYPLESVPEALRPYFYLNPSTAVVQNLRQIVFEGTLPGTVALLLPVLAGMLAAFAGRLVFGKLRRGFADVL